MLGWHISVYRQQNGGSFPALFGAPHGARLAVRQTGLEGLGWIDELVKQQKAIDLGGDGYPMKYTAMAAHLVDQLCDGPPGDKVFWTYADGYIDLPGWIGKTTKYQETIDADEWLIVEAWDRS